MAVESILLDQEAGKLSGSARFYEKTAKVMRVLNVEN